MKKREIALLLSTFERPAHLRRALLSIALQEGVEGKFELVVTDDGSRDETRDVVAQFGRQVNFPVAFTTHPHTTFQLARCRNEGVAASTADYLLFLDGDCILPRDHVRVHLERRKPGVVMAGDFVRLDRDTSHGVTEGVIRSNDFHQLATKAEFRRLRKNDRTARFYNFIHHPTKPKLFGNNIGIWRRDYERVNGYDEMFEGWGCEDDDLRYRLRKAGVRIESILRWTRTFHLWHPQDPTQPQRWRDGHNVNYLLRPGRLTRCRNGLVKRGLNDMTVRFVTPGSDRGLGRSFKGLAPDRSNSPAEVEILVLPGDGCFSGRADCNVLVALDRSTRASKLARQAHVIISAEPIPMAESARHYPLERFNEALDAVA